MSVCTPCVQPAIHVTLTFCFFFRYTITSDSLQWGLSLLVPIVRFGPPLLSIAHSSSIATQRNGVFSCSFCICGFYFFLSFTGLSTWLSPGSICLCLSVL